jgi:hypothetical protein
VFSSHARDPSRPQFKRSRSCGAASQYINFLAQAKIIGDAVGAGAGRFGLLAYFAATGARFACKTWRSGTKRADVDTYSLFAWGSWEAELPRGTPMCAYFAFWLWHKYGGEQLVGSATKGPLGSQASAYVTR